METSKGKKGWSWFEGAPAGEGNSPDTHLPDTHLPDPDQQLAVSYARCFSTQEGQKVLAHLKALTLERAFGPAIKTAMLRHSEGQRQLVSYVMAQVRRGENPNGQT